jgi:hypothetical protein
MSYSRKTPGKLQKTPIPKTPLKWIGVKYPLKGYFTPNFKTLRTATPI